MQKTHDVATVTTLLTFDAYFDLTKTEEKVEHSSKSHSSVVFTVVVSRSVFHTRVVLPPE